MSKTLKILARFLLLVVVFSLFAVAAPIFAGEDSPTPVDPVIGNQDLRSHTKCWIYNITISGYAGGQFFIRSGRLGVFSPGLVVPTPNGYNPYEMWIVSGEPGAGTAYPGELLFTTNTYFASSTAYTSGKRDMAYVQWLSTYVLQAKPHTAQNFSFPTNKYRIKSGAFRWADQGTIKANFSAHPKVTGTVYLKELNVAGTYGLSSSFPATFTGQLYSYSTSSACRFTNRFKEDVSVR